jgi:UDP-2-acetamido-3-amino-2,3-dideoxy-glucuronate N-acetyltransferase
MLPKIIRPATIINTLRPNGLDKNPLDPRDNVSVYDNVTLEEGVFCGPSMVFTNVYNPRSLVERKSEYRDTLVKKGATLGANCTIVCGVTIGRFSFVGAGAVYQLDKLAG